jgi:hypothetical protein
MDRSTYSSRAMLTLWQRVQQKEKGGSWRNEPPFNGMEKEKSFGGIIMLRVLLL